MKRLLLVLPFVLAACDSGVTAPNESAAMSQSNSKASAASSRSSCTTIQEGTLLDKKDNPIMVGNDKYGYNYQAHIFNGLSGNDSRPDVVVTDGTEKLVMKWSDNWLANVDCNSDSKLDRGLDPKTGVSTGTSAGWVTNHYEGDYLGSDNGMHHYTYFAKIAFDNGVACAVSSAFPCKWNLYTVTEEVQNDKFGEYGGRLHFINKLTGPGLGTF